MSDYVRYDGFLPKIRLACSNMQSTTWQAYMRLRDKAMRAGEKLQDENREGAGRTTTMTKSRVLVITLVEVAR